LSSCCVFFNVPSFIISHARVYVSVPVQIENTEALLLELNTFIEKEAKASKEFYERQMKETPTFDDSFKDNMVNQIEH